MRQIPFTPIALILVIASFILSGCVERYHPDELYLRDGLLVINAHITDEVGIQTIEISRSSHIEVPGFQAEENCLVHLFREDGDSREFSASEEAGYYAADLDADFLRQGMLFRVQVITANGNEYHSEFDQIRPVPAIDSIYYKVETVTYTGEEEPVPGIRFYVDFTHENEDSEYFRWELTETYEFHNPVMEAYVYPNRWTVRSLEGVDNSRICYLTFALPAVHSLSTKQLSFGSYSNAFDFVPNDEFEQKLKHKYSLLVRQYSVGPEGYNYWHELGENRQEQGQIFSRQPALQQSNICNIEDENEKVLGFFTMAGVQEARAFAVDIPGLDLSLNPYYCLPVDSGPGSGSPTTFPSYFARASYDGESVYAAVNHHCVDCREYKGSSAVKPDFW